MKKLIIFLVRKKLGLKKGERFRFVNQLSQYHTYYFTEDTIIKQTRHGWFKSSVSLNWMLDDECEIERVKYGY